MIMINSDVSVMQLLTDRIQVEKEGESLVTIQV